MPNEGLPYNHTSPSWPFWIQRTLLSLRSVMILPPKGLAGMADQQRSTGGVRNEPGDIYGTRLFANWAGGLRDGQQIDGSVSAYAPLTAGTDIGVPESGSNMNGDGTGLHNRWEVPPVGASPDSSPPFVRPYMMPGVGARGAPARSDAVGGDGSPRIGDERNAMFTDQSINVGPNPDSALGEIPGSFRIPRQFRMGLGHMAGPAQWGMPQYWDGGKHGDTLNVKPPMIPATDGTNARAIRGILGSVRAADSSHIPAVFTPSSIG